MRRLILMTTVLLGLLSVGAEAQGVLTPEDETLIREFVARAKPKPVRATERIEVGDTAPNSAELLSMGDLSPKIPQLAKFRYFVLEDKRIVIADPETRKVMYIVSPTI